MTHFQTLMADPPWPYKTPGKGPLAPATKTNPRAWESKLTGPGVRQRYGTLSVADIQRLPVATQMATDAHLYLWTTNAFLVEAHEVARAWGFRPITVITWTKTMKNDATRASMKTGFYFRGATEHVVFAVRGSLRLQSKRGVSTAFLHPREGHSVKPDAFYSLVEECSPGPYLELFARRPPRNAQWAVWGNEVASTVDLSLEV